MHCMNNLTSFTHRLLLTLICLGLTATAIAQSGITVPQASQKVQLTQTIGLTDVSVTYSSPAVNDREIWGKLVPMDQVWRAGANENTTISFSDDVTIEGEALPAGTYGLHTIPSTGDWTIIFSHNSTSWGSYSYNEKEDALRVAVSPMEGEKAEYLSYSFTDRSNDGATLVLAWDNMHVPVRIAVNSQEITLANIRNELRSTAGFTWMGYQQAANYCIQQETHYEEALGWIDQSVNMNTNFTNLSTKSQLLEKMEQTSEAKAAMDEAMEVATSQELYGYGAQLIGQQKPKEAMEIFKLQAKKYPDTWLSYAGLAAGNRVNGNSKEALKYYKKAKEGAPAQWQGPLDQRIASMEEEVQTAKK